MAQVVENLPSKLKPVSSIYITAKRCEVARYFGKMDCNNLQKGEEQKKTPSNRMT
jgi:hypothetical protein